MNVVFIRINLLYVHYLLLAHQHVCHSVKKRNLKTTKPLYLPFTVVGK